MNDTGIFKFIIRISNNNFINTLFLSNVVQPTIWSINFFV
jgi:hypothetical protein